MVTEFVTFLTPVDGLADVPVIVPDPLPPTTGIISVLAPAKAGSITKRTGIAGAHSLNEATQPGRKGTTPEELRVELDTIVNYLAVGKEGHKRYQTRLGVSFYSIYAHDYCHLAGAYFCRESGGRRTRSSVVLKVWLWNRGWAPPLTNKERTICFDGCDHSARVSAGDRPVL